MKAAILYSNYLDPAGQKRKIGGIETYIQNLTAVCQRMDLEPTVYQWAKSSFENDVGRVRVKGFPVQQLPYKKRPAALLQGALEDIDPGNDIVIFASDQQAVFSHCNRAISIQHGIAWDLPNRFLSGHKMFHEGRLGAFYKTLLQRRFRNYYERCPNRVCVDYNFLNWYRTQLVVESKGRNWVIPNFSKIASPETVRQADRNGDTIQILFARRFLEIRGTRIMAEATRNILEMHPNAHFTFAGEGPDEDWLKKQFANDTRISFLKFLPDEALGINLKHDIAVVPSLASEGTSLSVAEAMGTGCAVIATSIGGITNMIIDGYNGLLVAPDASELTEALALLVKDGNLRKRLGNKAYDVASHSFSLSAWQTRWGQVLETVAQT